MKIFALILLIGVPLNCVAQANIDSVNWEMLQNGLFHPHADNCSNSEAFMPLGSGSTSGGTGICVEKDERSVLNFEDARLDCADEGKRLPEMAEYRRACGLAGSLGLNNMTDDYEWASNFPQVHSEWVSNGYSAANAYWGSIIMGNSSCFQVAFGIVGHTSPSATAYNYRCVH